MNLEIFLQKFEHFADAPDAAAKIRELILHSAVTGRLSEKQAGDSPVSEILEEGRRIAQPHRRSNWKRGGFEVGPSERLSHVPGHWEWIPLKEIGTISGGMTPSKDKPVFWGGSVNWFSSKDIKSDELFTSELKITSEAVASTRLQVYLPGSLVFVARSGILKRTFPVAILRTEGTVNQDLKVLSPFVSGFERYIQIMLRGMTRHILSSLVKTGMTVQSLKFEAFESQPFPFPPLAEQKRIVAKVDELMALCDRLEAQQKERETRHAALAHASLAHFADTPTPANLTFLFHKSYSIPPAYLRASILSLAVQGKLVSPHANDEPVDESLKRNDERRRAIAANDRRADSERLPLLSADDRWPIPDSWGWRALGDLALFVDYRGKTPLKQFEGIRLLTAKNVRAGHITLSPEEFISENEYQAWMTRGLPNVGDVLFTTEAPMGNAAVVTLTERFALAQRVICLQRYGAIDPHFLVFHISSDQFQHILDRNGTGVTAKGIKGSKLKQLPIAVPPLAEQRRIVAKVDQLMGLVDQLERHLAVSRTTATKLLDALVSELTGVSKGLEQ